MGELIEGAMQQAPQPARQFIKSRPQVRISNGKAAVYAALPACSICQLTIRTKEKSIAVDLDALRPRPVSGALCIDG
jgi:hypothetical protein